LPEAAGRSAFSIFRGIGSSRLEALSGLRERLFDACSDHGIRGTILLAPEGINFFLAGAAKSSEAFLDTLAAIRDCRESK
jgi:predicted sulfurtransferase